MSVHASSVEIISVVPNAPPSRAGADSSRNISGYLVTITLMNGAVGVATGFANYMFGLSNPVLWGVLALS